MNSNDISRIDQIQKKVNQVKRTFHNDLINVFEMEDLFDEMFTLFKSKMVGGEAMREEPIIVNTIINGKLIPVDLNIAIS